MEKKNLNLFKKKNKNKNKIRAKNSSLSLKTSLTTNFLNNIDMKKWQPSSHKLTINPWKNFETLNLYTNFEIWRQNIQLPQANYKSHNTSQKNLQSSQKVWIFFIKLNIPVKEWTNQQKKTLYYEDQIAKFLKLITIHYYWTSWKCWNLSKFQGKEKKQ